MGEIANPRVVFASANVSDPRFRNLFLVRPESIGRFAKEAGFDGVELTPAFDWIASPGSVARAVDDGDLVLNSLHASFRTTRRSRSTNKASDSAPAGPRMEQIIEAGIASPIGRLLMPEVVNSSHYMRKVKDKVGAQPSVLYPQPDSALDRRVREDAGPGLRLVQATDHIAAMIRARTAMDFVEMMQERGYDGWILDSIHLDPDRYGGQYPRVVSDLDHSLSVLRPAVYGAHIALNRSDIVPKGSALAETTRGDLERALRGEFTGVIDQVMTAAWEAPNFTYAALEATASGVSEVTGHSNREELLADYQLLAQSVRDYRA